MYVMNIVILVAIYVALLFILFYCQGCSYDKEHIAYPYTWFSLSFITKFIFVLTICLFLRVLMVYIGSFLGLEIENFPAEVNSTVTFRCFRVSSIDESVDQFAYQTSVNIGGRVFKGILYDQGPHESRYYFGESSSRQLQEPNLPSADALTPGALASTSGAAESLAHPSYPFPLTASMSGTQLFLHPKS